MPFDQLVNPQQIEVSVAGPGDVDRLYLCAGLARGNFVVTLSPGTSAQVMRDTWQFEVGPRIDSAQFRRAIATASFAGFELDEKGLAAAFHFWVDAVFADFDDDEGTVRVSVNNSIQAIPYVQPPGGPTEFLGLSELAYNVSILAAGPPG